MTVTPQVHNDDSPALSRVTPRPDASTHMKFLGQDVAILQCPSAFLKDR